MKWKKIETELNQILDSSESERGLHLKKLKDDDPEIHSEVSAMLDAIEGSSRFMQGNVFDYFSDLIR